MSRLGHRMFLDSYMPTAQLMKLFYGTFVLLPVLDNHLIGPDWSNPSTEQAKNTQSRWWFKVPLHLWVAVELISTIKVMDMISHPKSHLRTRDKLALLTILGFYNGAVGINISHELGHKKWVS